MDLEYDADTMHGDVDESREWFFVEVLGADPQDDNAKLVLHSNLIGDEVGVVDVVSVNPAE